MAPTLLGGSGAPSRTTCPCQHYYKTTGEKREISSDEELKGLVRSPNYPDPNLNQHAKASPIHGDHTLQPTGIMDLLPTSWSKALLDTTVTPFSGHDSMSLQVRTMPNPQGCSKDFNFSSAYCGCSVR